MAGDCLQQLIGEIFRVRRCEPHALDAPDVRDRNQQVGKIMSAVAVGVDVLAEEGHLLAPAGGEGFGFPHDADEVAAALAAAGVRDHAEGAEVVAAAHDGEPGGDALDAIRDDIGVGLVFGEVHRHPFPARSGLLEQVRQGPVAVRADQHVDERVTGQEVPLEVLRHAAQHADHEAPLLLERLE